eukprot:TRINITY_DN1696_c0_g1_i2.p1 TRINITY_DN1696_c0_g1~~TRINITY_DN1696_c0_g1_i2.p1  ORF type:complete len:214 (+),score=20.65 TRINITY_DN1696_c0_g1_i2:62-643(+)
MSQVGWKASILLSLETNRSLVYSKYIQLATIKTNGRPANRTIVFRGFLGETDNLTFTTDTRSNKVVEIAANPFGEICWYFPNSREQYRISGTLKVIDQQYGNQDMMKARTSMWRNMSSGARQQFLWPQPGLPRELDDHEKYNPMAPSTDSEPSDNFCLVVMEPQDVDHILLLPNQRFLYWKEENEWKQSEVNP